jgi:hypothetical protein
MEPIPEDETPKSRAMLVDSRNVVPTAIYIIHELPDPVNGAARG